MSSQRQRFHAYFWHDFLWAWPLRNQVRPQANHNKQQAAWNRLIDGQEALGTNLPLLCPKAGAERYPPGFCQQAAYKRAASSQGAAAAAKNDESWKKACLGRLAV